MNSTPISEPIAAARSDDRAPGGTQIPPESLIFDPGAHSYELAGRMLPSVTTVLAAAGLTRYDFAPPEERQLALDRGTAVHRITAEFDQGLPVEPLPFLMPYLEAWRDFKRDYGFECALIEHRVHNERCGFAGQLDRSGVSRDGTRWLIDLKSGVAPSSTRFQTAAYVSCLPHPRSYRRAAVELHPSGSYRVLEFSTNTYAHDLNVFLRALAAYRAGEQACS